MTGLASSSKSNSVSGEFLKQFLIPSYIIVPNGVQEGVSDMPECPVVVFINSKSGGQLGGDLFATYRSVLHKHQVFDLSKEAPDKVLSRLYANLEKLKSNGDRLAFHIEKYIRIIVAGGDGTAGWLLGVVSDLKLRKPPSVATVPLGTGNNLPFAFGWGKKNPGTDQQAVVSFLKKVKSARDMKMDSWHILMRMKAPKQGACDPITPLELPHSLHAFHRVSSQDSMSLEGYHTFRGGFWNYFSLGMDAEISYAFHAERKLHPERFKNQLINQGNYAKLALTKGALIPFLFHPSGRSIAQLAKVKVMRTLGKWEDLPIPASISSIVCLNLPSFSGGLNPWGTPNERKKRDRGLTPPFVDDHFIEVVGFRDAWHGLVLLSKKGHGTRLAQAQGIRFEFHKGAADHTYMRMDGEPWKQPLPTDDDTIVVEISHLGQVNMLATDECIAKSVHDSVSKKHESNDDGDSEEEDDDDSVRGVEAQRKFGAADTFRIPDGVDVSALS